MVKKLQREHVLLLAAAGALLSVAFYLSGPIQLAHGSTDTGEDHNATTTYALSTPVRTLKTGQGTLAQITITGDNTGLMTFYDATTTDVTKRTGNKATSTIIIADFPASAPEGTYMFDAHFTDGLVVVTSGAPATSTITWK